MNQKFQSATFDLTGKIFGAAVFVVSLIFYFLTVQRTLSFWDCGEFVACSYILGIAHPPGTPLFILLGRIFTMIPIVTDIGFRVNILSVLSSAVAATIGYMVSVRLLHFMPGVSENSAKRLCVYISSFVGAMLFAFGRTQWSNSVEAEVYSMAMALTFLLIWLSLKWYDNRGTATANKYLILIAYIGVLAVGIHLTVFLVMPAIFIFLLIADESLRKDYRFWISGILLFTVTVDIKWFIYSMLAWTTLTLLMYLSSRSKAWLLALALASAGLTGFSVHAYIPIRADENPHINQNNPRTWSRFQSYLGRKQYGNESMFEKMFKRRASWAHQLGRFPRIGMGGFLMDQWGTPGFWFLIPVFLAAIGVISLIKWKWRVGTFIFLVLIACTVGLVIYMNFADGSLIDPMTGNDKLEVRDRDYFFTPGFIMFGLCIGFGLCVALSYLVDKLGTERGRLAIIAGGVLACFIPISAIKANYQFNDRSDSYLPYEYAYNFLMSCPQDAIMFTNGDNDTFPVWCLQEVYGIRRDVKVANLSLIQTDWYQLQLKHQLGIPVGLEDDQMTWTTITSSRGTYSRPLKPYVDRFRGGWNHYMFPFQDSASGQLITVAHMMVENIIAANNWKYPIVFANGYPPEVKYPIAQHTLRRGWVNELVQSEANGAWDVDTSMHLFQDVCMMDGINNPHVFRDEVATTLVIGTAQIMAEFVDYLDSKKDTSRSAIITDLMIKQMPEFWQSYAKKSMAMKYDKAQQEELFNKYFIYLDSLMTTNPENIFYYQYKALALQYIGKSPEAVKAAEEAYALNPVVPITYRSLLSLYMSVGRRDDAVRISREYLITNPSDQTARQVASGRF